MAAHRDAQFLDALGGAGRRQGHPRGGRRRAAERQGLTPRRTVLFIDEIHRFNKGQQDALLPYVEDGTDHADRRHDREPFVRTQLRAAVAAARVRAALAGRGRDPASCCAMRWPMRSADLARGAAAMPESWLARIAEAADGDARRALIAAGDRGRTVARRARDRRQRCWKD